MKSIAQKTTKGTRTKPLDLDRPIHLKPVAAEKPAAEPDTARGFIHAADTLGEHNPTHDFRLEDATAATMLIRSISPWECYAVVLGGLDHAADELVVLSAALGSEVDLDPDMVIHVLAGIENRLRVLREVASRVHKAQAEEVSRGGA